VSAVTNVVARALLVTLVVSAATPVHATEPAGRLYLTLDKSKHLVSAERITRVAVASPRVADVVVISPQQLLINGREVGSTTLILFHDNKMQAFDLIVYPAPIAEAAAVDPASEPYTVLVQRADKVTNQVFVRGQTYGWLELGTVKLATEAAK
jgi:Flp pilus assembly secretin CpaC